MTTPMYILLVNLPHIVLYKFPVSALDGIVVCRRTGSLNIT